MQKICLIEDDRGILGSLKLYLENSDFEVVPSETGDGAVEFILAEKPDLTILDINLPVLNGVEICLKLRKTSNIPVIMLTAKDGEQDKISGLDAGADDYIAKPFSPRELLARIKSNLRRSEKKSENTSEILTFNHVVLDTKKMEVRVKKELVSMTKNEYDILEKIWKADGALVSRETLMTEVIGYDNYMYDRTIDTHIKNLRKKLGDKDMILTIRGKGYRLNT